MTKEQMENYIINIVGGIVLGFIILFSLGAFIFNDYKDFEKSDLEDGKVYIIVPVEQEDGTVVEEYVEFKA